jgi:hypothetical protein
MRPRHLVYRYRRGSDPSQTPELWDLEAPRLKLTANLRQLRKENHRLDSVIFGNHR